MALIEPHKVQKKALEALQKARREGKRKALSVLPSGIGKTYLAAFDCKQVNAKKVLYLAHRHEILTQARDAFLDVYEIPKNKIDTCLGFVNQRRKEFDRPFVFATVQTMYHEKNLDKLRSIMWDYVIVDEFHHAAADSYVRIMDNLNTKFLHGLTATPQRYDEKDILPYVDYNIASTMDLEKGIKSGLLVPFIYNAMYDDIDYRKIEYDGHSYNEKDLDKKLLIDKRDLQIFNDYKENVAKFNLKCIAFCVNVRHCHRMHALFSKHGIRSAIITHETGPEARVAINEGFEGNEYDILFTRDIYNEGVDFPSVEALLMLRPTLSSVVFFQQLGRGLRRYPNKRAVLVYDLVGNYVNAYQREKWLSFGQRHVERIRIDKPVYHHNVASVHFDSKVIEIFRRQAKHAQAKQWYLSPGNIPTKQQLIDNYFAVKKILQGVRRPFRQDMYLHKGMSHFSARQYDIVFGGYIKFLSEIGENLRRDDVTKDDLIKFYKERKAKNIKIQNKLPTVREWAEECRTHGFGIRGDWYRKKWGTWNKFLVHVGDLESYYGQLPTREQAIQDYLDVKKTVGRQPQAKDFTKERRHLSKYKYHLSTLTRMFKNMQGLREAAGEIKPDKQTTLAENYFEVKENLGIRGRPIYSREWKRIKAAGQSRWGIGSYDIHFGSWNRFLEAVGELPEDWVPNKRLHHMQEAIDNYNAVKQKLGRRPKHDDMYTEISKIGAKRYHWLWGSWTEFIRAMGDPVYNHNKGQHVSQEWRKRLPEGPMHYNTGELNPMYGRKHSAETIKKMRKRKA